MGQLRQGVKSKAVAGNKIAYAFAATIYSGKYTYEAKIDQHVMRHISSYSTHFKTIFSIVRGHT